MIGFAFFLIIQLEVNSKSSAFRMKNGRFLFISGKIYIQQIAIASCNSKFSDVRW